MNKERAIRIEALQQRALTLLLAGLLVVAVVPLTSIPTATAQDGRMSLLLDAEVDDYVNGLAEPLFKAAGLSPENVHVLVLNSPQINAFVNSQRSLFMMSGLLLEAETANEVTGVIAHEIGHLKGHHLLRLNQAQSSLTLSSLVSGLIGIGAIAAGAPQAGSAVLVGGQAAGISSLLKFSRSQEQQADQIAVNLLKEENMSAEGLQSFFARLGVQSQMYHKTPPEYLLTHPKPAGRENFLAQNVTTTYTPSPAEKTAFRRMQAKVLALTHTPAQTRRRLFEEDDGFADYARAVAFIRAGQFDEAQQSLEHAVQKLGLTDDPYVDALYGHIALENGNTEKAQNLFETALNKSPQSTLLRYQYGRTLLMNNQHQNAIAQLERVLNHHEQWWMAHQQIGIAYGKVGQPVAAHIHLAQASLYQGNHKDADFHLQVALKKLSERETAKPETNSAEQAQTINLLQRELEKLRN